MQHCILVKWTPDAGDKDALAKEAEAIFAQAVADGGGGRRGNRADHPPQRHQPSEPL